MSGCARVTGAPVVVEQLDHLRAAAIGLTITRVFDAPRQLVWNEWTEPDRFADWFGGAKIDVPLSTVSLDLVPGGTWTATTLSFGPDRRHIRWHGEYIEINEPERLVFTILGFPGAPSPDLVTVTFTDLGDGRTEMLLRQQGQRSPDQYERSRKYWSAELDQIARHLTAPGNRGISVT
jgi:uncharacterized protein YndB with AHSA1/START domain